MSHLDARNKRALSSGQAAWDNALPPEDDGEQEYVDEQVEHLLYGYNTESVMWDRFAETASEMVSEEDSDNSVVRIMLALREEKFELAREIYMQKFETVICGAAEGCVRTAMGKRK